MAKESSNPFVLPGFGQEGEAARNPLFAGLEMMRQAWQGMAGNGFEAPGLPMMSVEDLDRRIGELRTVQNWLQLNASILGNTIQGLEIQRATLSTLRSFADQGAPEAFAGSASHAGDQSRAARGKGKDTTAGMGTFSSAGDPDGGDSGQQAAAATQAMAQAAGDWWNMLQQQFQTLADATAATLKAVPDAEAAMAAVTPVPAASATAGAKPVARKTAARKAASAGARKSSTASGTRAGTAAGRKARG